MKKFKILMALSIGATLLVGCGGAEENPNAPFLPSDDIDWIVTSSPGGGSDIYTRVITDIIKQKGLVEENFLINNQTDGGGEVGRLRVSQEKDDGHMLLTFNSGDLTPMVQNTSNRVENFKPIAIMAVDSQILLEGVNTEYETFQDALDAAANGTSIIIGGSKGDDIALYEELLEVSGLEKSQLTYMMFDATSEALTSLLGGHIDYCISKPAASMQYIESGDAEAAVAFKTQRFSSGILADVPILSEVTDLEDIESSVWRGIVAPGNMPDKAVAYWSDIMRQVSESEEWKTQYLDKNVLESFYLPADEAKAYMTEYQNDYLEQIGKAE